MAGAPPGERRPTFWERFLDQKSAPQRFLLALSALLTTVVAIGAAVVTVSGWFGDDAPAAIPSPSSSSTTGSTTAPTGVVAQGSPEADALVRTLLAAEGKRVPLDAVLVARRSVPRGTDIESYFELWYGCTGDPGNDTCNTLEITWEGFPAPPTVRSPFGMHLRGQFSVTLFEGTIYGTDLGLDLAPVE